MNGIGPANHLPSQVAKRKHTEDDRASEPVAKKHQAATRAPRSAGKSKGKSTKVKDVIGASTTAPTASVIIKQPPTQVLAVMAFGNGEAGELGLGPDVLEAPRPRLNPFLDPENPSALRTVQLACGGMHTVALTADNKVVTWGVNDNGALGRDVDWEGGLRDIDGDPEQLGELNPLESTPSSVPADHFAPGSGFVQVAAGDSCSFALTDAGLVYGWGTFKDSNGEERFGFDLDGKIIERQTRPLLIPGLKNITQIVCGANHAVALDTNGVIWAWGCGEQNQLGRRLLGRRELDSFKPHRVEIKNAKYIATGQYHSFAIDSKDNVWGWGLNSFGQAGYGKTAGGDFALAPHPIKISGLCGKGVTRLDGGLNHSAAVTSGGQCLVWGRIDDGQLGIEFTAEQLQDEKLIRYSERNDPRICLLPTQVPSIGPVRWVACGTDHTIFITEEGAAYSTGFNSQGQLGLGDEEDVSVAQRIKAKALKDKALSWAGAGGQFSVVAAVA